MGLCGAGEAELFPVGDVALLFFAVGLHEISILAFVVSFKHTYQRECGFRHPGRSKMVGLIL